MKTLLVLLLLLLALTGCSSGETPAAIPSPQIIGEWKMEEGFVLGSAVAAIHGTDYLFLATNPGGASPGEVRLCVLDMREPSSPVEVAGVAAPQTMTSSPFRLAVTGTTLYGLFMGPDSSWLWVVDVADPATPQEITSVPIEYGTLDFAVSGDLMCITAFPPVDYLLYDISEPRNPVPAGEPVLQSGPTPPVIHRHLALEDSRLYISRPEDLTVVDLSSPSSPEEAGVFSNPGYIAPVREAVPDAGSGLVRTARLEDTLDDIVPASGFGDISVSGSNAYIAAGEDGLILLDISNPASISVVARLATPDRIMRVSASGNRACLIGMTYTGSAFNLSAHVVDISIPANPSFSGSIGNFASLPVNQFLETVGNLFLVIGPRTVYVIDPGSR